MPPRVSKPKKKTPRKPRWVDVKVDGPARVLRDDAGRVFDSIDVGGEEVLRKFPDPPPVNAPGFETNPRRAKRPRRRNS